jgi:hypothetical protein
MKQQHPFGRPFDGKPDQVEWAMGWLISPEGLETLRLLRRNRERASKIYYTVDKESV